MDAKGQVSTMAYDVLGRMKSRSEPDLNAAWTYDTQPMGVGKLATVTTDNGYARTENYDSLGRVSSEATAMGTESFIAQRSYDTNGRLLTLTYPTGFSVRYEYTLVGYLKDVKRVDTGALLWQANAMDALGHPLQFTYGNGVVTSGLYDRTTGRLNNLYAGAGNMVQNLSYQYDYVGNLLSRTDGVQNEVENFGYDALNRLQSATVQSSGLTGILAKNYAYDALGNITCKGDISACSSSAANYIYNAGVTVSGITHTLPHAVGQITGTVNGIVNPAFAYDANGNMISGAGRTSTWTSYNMVASMTRGTGTESFLYDANHERAKEVNNEGTTYYLSPRYDTGIHFEKTYFAVNGAPTGVVEYEHYLYAGGMMFGIYKTHSDGTTSLRYLHTDNQNSVTAITDEAGNVAERLAYDPFGKRRFATGADDPNNSIVGVTTRHGYTSHEMLDEVGVTNMNGRMYDPLLGRFVSADSNIQSPYSTQSYNRYAYVLNNPLSLTDPSGYLFDGLFDVPFIDNAWNNHIKPVVPVVAAIVVAVYAPQISAYIGWSSPAAATGAAAAYGPAIVNTGLSATLGISSGAVASGMLGGAMAGAIMGGDLRSAVIGGIAGGAFGWAGDIGQANGLYGTEHFAAHAAAGCLQGELGGGGCGRGAISGMAGLEGGQYGFIGATVAGGTVSVIGGGKFGNGAITGAFGYLFNDCNHGEATCVRALRGGSVVRSGWQDSADEGRGAGWRVTVREPDGAQTMYGHLTPNETPPAGTVLDVNGEIANYANPSNGHSSGPHVHVQTWSPNGQIVAPGGQSPILNGVLRTPYQQVDSLHPHGHQGEDYVAPR